MNKSTRMLIFLALLCGLMPVVGRLSAQEGNRAALVVDWGDGQIYTECISFPEASISGYELLSRSGLPLEVDAQGGIGAAVCSINGTGCPGNDCFCACPGGDDCVYWSYWHLNGGSWSYSSLGAGQYQVSNGMVDGWVWGPGSVNDANPPISTSFDAICPALVVPTDTPTPLPPTATPLPPTTTPLPATATRAPEVRFSSNETFINQGNCTTLYWEVEHVDAVYLDDVGVSGTGFLEICPDNNQTYTLRAEAGGESINKSIAIEVGASAAPATVPPALPSPTPQAIAVATVPPLPTATTIPLALPPTTSPSPTVEIAPTSTAIPTALPTVTPLPTATEVLLLVPTLERVAVVTLMATATPQEIAAVATEEMPVIQPASGTITADATSANDFDVIGYSFFGFIVLILGTGLFIIRRGDV